MRRQFTASIWREGDWFVAQCLEVEVAAGGRHEARQVGTGDDEALAPVAADER